MAEYMGSSCGNCGKSVDRNAKKCPHCGVIFSGEKTQTITQTRTQYYEYSEQAEAMVGMFTVKSIILTVIINIIILALLYYFMGFSLIIAIVMCLILDCLILPISYILTSNE